MIADESTRAPHERNLSSNKVSGKHLLKQVILPICQKKLNFGLTLYDLGVG